MKTSHSVENLLRSPWEWSVAAMSATVAGFSIMHPSVFGLTAVEPAVYSGFFASLAGLRFWQGLKVFRYQRNLLQLKHYSLTTKEIPCSKKQWFMGKGFMWQPTHRQRLDLLAQVQFERFRHKSPLHQWVQRACEKPNSRWRPLQRVPYFKPLPDIGGKPWLHGVGADSEKLFFVPQGERNGHLLVMGKTRVGKTRLLSILAAQDIGNGEAVLVLDPKGDLSLLQEIYAAAKAAGRLDDLLIVHAGCPEWSAKYNPLQCYTDIAEVTERVTSAIDAEGEGKQFKDFAWKYLNTTAICLEAMGMPITYQSLSFFVLRPVVLFEKFSEFRLKQWYPDAEEKIAGIIALSTKIKKDGTEERISRNEAILEIIKERINTTVSSSDANTLNSEPLFDIYEAAHTAQDYYKKITASLSPVFDKINKTKAHSIFSWTDTEGLPTVDWESVVKRKKIVYVGLDSLTNQAMSEAIGKAMIADLVSMFGRFQRDGAQRTRTLCCYFDELSEVLPDAFVRLLNKAGGAGAQVTAFAQTANDIAATLGSQDKAKMVVGNFGMLAMLRIANTDTARLFTESLELIRTRILTPSSVTQDKASGRDQELFTTQNSDSISETPSHFVNENDLFSLPKGHLFLVYGGGQVAKVRVPLPKADGHPPDVLEDMCAEVNYA